MAVSEVQLLELQRTIDTLRLAVIILICVFLAFIIGQCAIFVCQLIFKRNPNLLNKGSRSVFTEPYVIVHTPPKKSSEGSKKEKRSSRSKKNRHASKEIMVSFELKNENNKQPGTQSESLKEIRREAPPNDKRETGTQGNGDDIGPKDSLVAAPYNIDMKPADTG
ncbi:hypothetical protein AB6A40_005167 [Gnathostoma spinigerum]|uniref:Uncharacterized protein n=1 Tax=Gnathostoma spinigerum TaxID=75299 RepID=A0ABD6EEN5_9BILA